MGEKSFILKSIKNKTILSPLITQDFFSTKKFYIIFDIIFINKLMIKLKIIS